MKKIVKRLLSLVVATVMVFTGLSAGFSANALGTLDPETNIYFAPCVGYTRVWDTAYPCEGELIIPEYYGGLPVTQIWTGALNYTDITGVVIPDTVESLTSGYNFDGCRELKYAVISNGLTIIPNNAFSNCDLLETVELGYSVEKIYCNAFMNCPNLEYVELPESIKEIRYGAFHCGFHTGGGLGLQCAYYPGNIDSWKEVVVEDPTLLENILYITKINKTTSTFGGISVKADPRPGAAKYVFYRQEKVNGKWTKLTKIKSTKSSDYIDKKAQVGHTYRYAVKAVNGPYKTRMSTVGKEVTYSKVSSVKLSKTEYTYNGEVRKPVVTVKDSAGKKLKKGTDYTLKYSKGRKKVGTYKVTVTLKGKYSGTKVLTFKINPQKTKVSKLTAAKKSLTVSVAKKTSQVSGYQIQYSTSKSFKSAKTKTVNKAKTTSATIKKLKAKKTYFVRVRTYKTVDGKKYYSAWSSYKSKRTK